MVERDRARGGSSLLSLDGVALARGGRTLFEGLTLALGPGEALVVTGPNGVGKSSLIRLAAGLLTPVAGIVRWEGRTALLSEAAALDPELTLAAALRFWAGLDATDAVDAALNALGLTALADVPVRMLSTGQRRRAALARVVASGAALWLLDEPANGLDVASVAVLEQLIAGHRAGGGAVLVATHLPIAVPGAGVLDLHSVRAALVEASSFAEVKGGPSTSSGRTEGRAMSFHSRGGQA